MKVTAVLLAAGQGTRMKSNLPKVLHAVAGKPMIWHVLQAVSQVSDEKPVVVVGHGADEATKYLADSALTVLQEPQLGTAHAVMQAEALLKGKTDLALVCYGDMPLLRGETLQKLVETQKNNEGPISMLTVIADDPRGFGRIIRRADGTVEAIVEESAKPRPRVRIEVNLGESQTDMRQTAQATVRTRGRVDGKDIVVQTGPLSRDGVRIDLKDHRTDKDLLINQFLMVQSGSSATIQVGRAVPFVDFFYRYALEQELVASNVRWQNIGSQLRIRPFVHGRLITVEVIPEITAVEDLRRNIISFRKLATVVTVADGQTVQIGGFKKADADFNRNFFSGVSQDGHSLSGIITLRASIQEAPRISR